MKRVMVVLAMLACVVSSGSFVRAQSNDTDELRETLQALQQKLNAMEDNDTSSATRQRTTQLGRTKVIMNEEPELVVQIYDLSDLLAVVSPYPAMVSNDIGPFGTPTFPDALGSGVGYTGAGGMGGMGGGMGGMGGGFMNVVAQQAGAGQPNSSVPGNAPPVIAYPLGRSLPPAGLASSRISMDDLIRAITSTIEPTSWDEVGGPGSISPLGNNLLIRATLQTHKQITALFDAFRKKWGTLRTVSVQAHWLWLSEEEAASVLVEKKDTGEFAAFGVVQDEAWDKLLKRLRENVDDRPSGYQAVVTCYNGQTVNMQSGAQRRIVAGMIPVVGGGPEGTGYQPEMATLQEGAALQITPSVTSGGKLVVLDVHSRVVLSRDDASHGPLEKESGTAWKTDVRDVALAIDRPLVAAQKIETTLRVPVAKRMLIGGMTFEAVPEPGQPSLYLFIKPVVQELRDDAPAETKAEAGKAESKPKAEAKGAPKG